MRRTATEVVYAHRIADDRAAAFGPEGEGSLPAAALERYLDERGDWERVGPEALLRPDGGGPAPGRLLLTFDDGFAGFAEEVLPVLERHRAPCVLFVVTGFADGAWQPYEMQLARMLAGRDHLYLPDGSRVDTPDDAARASLYERLRLVARPLPPAARREFLAELVAAQRDGGAAPEPDAGAFLGWDALRELDRHPLVHLGVHGERHALLPALDGAEAEREIAGARARLERELGHEVPWFAYPYGGQGRRERALVQGAGFRLAFATRGGSLRRFLPTGRFAVPRIDLADVLRELRHAA